MRETQVLAASPHLARIPIVMMTDNASWAALVRSRAAGAGAFVVKPFTRASPHTRARRRTVRATVHTPWTGGAKLGGRLSLRGCYMSGIPARGSPAPSGWFGILGAWLQARSKETSPTPEDLPGETGRPPAHFYGSVRVLVVDDNPVNLMVISALLESRGLVPLLAADGAEAVALACELHFDLILMDLQMPILDGLGATSAIRRFESDSARRAVPVVAYSSSSMGAGVLARHGLNGSLSKPCDDLELEDCLVRWCPGYRSAPAGRVQAQGKGYWPPAGRAPDAHGASLR